MRAVIIEHLSLSFYDDIISSISIGDFQDLVGGIYFSPLMKLNQNWEIEKNNLENCDILFLDLTIMLIKYLYSMDI